jgi:hypothetical protein
MTKHMTGTGGEWLAARGPDTMNARDTNLGVRAAEDARTFHSSARSRWMRRTIASPPMIVTRPETSGVRSGWVNAAALGAAGWLCLAAAPTFATMALLTGVPGVGPRDMLCLAARDASPLSGMVPMYLLMSVFHLVPWLKLLSRRRRGAHRF